MKTALSNLIMQTLKLPTNVKTVDVFRKFTFYLYGKYKLVKHFLNLLVNQS